MKSARRPLAVAAVALSLLATLLAVPTPTAQALPPGFTQTVIAVLPSGLTTVKTLANGSVAVLQKTGVVRVMRDGALVAAPALTLGNVCSGNDERGLLGITSGTSWSGVGSFPVWIYYTANKLGTCVNRVSRFTMSGDTIDPGSETVILDNIPSTGSNHNGGDVEIGRDGQLYVAVGDAGTDPRGDSGGAGANDAAQDLSILNGKILRVDPGTGLASVGNPFAGEAVCRVAGTSTPQNQRCSEIYAYGLRNPYRIALDTNAPTTRIFINDVGQATREEVDELVAGANYGWPCREGLVAQPGAPSFCATTSAVFTNPITDYGRSLGRSITGGAFVPAGRWPAAYDGAYLMADYGGTIWVRFANGSLDYDSPFADVPGVTDIAAVEEPGGLAVYAVTNPVGQVVRIFLPDPAVPIPSDPLRYEPVALNRILDTRRAQDGGQPLPGGVERTINSGAGAGTVAVAVNIAYVTPASRGFLTAWQTGRSRPPTANINADAGEVVSNFAVVPVDELGRFQLYSQVTADVVVDLVGRFVPAPAAVTSGRFVSITPGRLADTREPVGTDNPFVRRADGEFSVVQVPVRGRRGLPNSGIAAVVLTVAGLSSGNPLGGFVTVVPGGATRPVIAGLNTNGGQDTRLNTVVMPLGPDGTVDLHLFRVNEVVVDVVGYFTDATAPVSTSGRFRSLRPYREVDTRIPLGFGVATGSATKVLDPVSVPNNAIAVSQNVVLVDNWSAGFVTAYGAEPRPTVSSGNVDGPGQVRAAAGFSPLDGGIARYFVLPVSNVVVDVTGYFEP